MTERSTAVRSDARIDPGSGDASSHSHGIPAPRTAPSGENNFSQIRDSLQARLDELRQEHDTAMTELRALQRDRQSDTAGDDQADTGTKTFERERELTLAHGILERIDQVERAINRIDEGTYGQCERCGNQIPIARLEAFPSATLCVTCKQRQERR